MKKFLKIIMILALIVILCIVGLTSCMDRGDGWPAAPENYWESVNTSGEMEKKYTALGSFEGSYIEYKSDNKLIAKREIWYPSEMEKDDKNYPLVIMANGTGVAASKYTEVFKHLASWGFIVVGDENPLTAHGDTLSNTLDYMLALNENKDSIFCGKIDTAHIGVAGHSQGGFGAIRAALDYGNSDRFAAIFTASATTQTMLNQFNLEKDWGNYDTAKLKAPIFMVAGTHSSDADSVSPLADMQKNFEKIPTGVPAVMARRTGTSHGEMLYSADGYMTAWFMCWLKDDAEAEKAFFGENAELFANPNWQDAAANAPSQ
jgi:S-formylglutathione hydrolase FrmB